MANENWTATDTVSVNDSTRVIDKTMARTDEARVDDAGNKWAVGDELAWSAPITVVERENRQWADLT